MEVVSLFMSLGVCIKSHPGPQRQGACIFNGAMIYEPSSRIPENQLGFRSSPPGGRIIPGKPFLLDRGSICQGLSLAHPVFQAVPAACCLLSCSGLERNLLERKALILM